MQTTLTRAAVAVERPTEWARSRRISSCERAEREEHVRNLSEKVQELKHISIGGWGGSDV